MRNVRPRLIAEPIGILSRKPPYTPTIETMPKLRQQWIAWRSTCGRSVPMNSATLTRSSAKSKLAAGLGLGADGIDAGIRAAALGQLHDALVDVLFHEIDGVGRAGRLGPARCAPARFRSAMTRAGAQQRRRFGWRIARPGQQPQIAIVSPPLMSQNSARHVAGRENVGEEQHLLVAEPVRHLDRPDIGVRHPQIFGLAAGIAAESDANSRTGPPANCPIAARPLL